MSDDSCKSSRSSSSNTNIGNVNDITERKQCMQNSFHKYEE